MTNQVTYQDIANNNMSARGDILVTVKVSCGIKQSSIAPDVTEDVLKKHGAEQGAGNFTVFLLPDPVKDAKKWCENHRKDLYIKAKDLTVKDTSLQGGMYKTNGSLCARVKPQRQQAYLPMVEEYVNLCKRKLLDAITDSNTHDRQAGYKQVKADHAAASKTLLTEVNAVMPRYYEDYLAYFDVYSRVIPFSSTPEYDEMESAVIEAIKNTENTDACESYNLMIDELQKSVLGGINKLKAISVVKRDKSKKDFKYPNITKSALNSVLFDKVSTIQPLIPVMGNTTELFRVCWTINGSTPDEMRQFFVSAGKIKDTQEAWDKVVKKNKKLGKTNHGVRGQFDKLFDDEVFKSLPINRHEAAEQWRDSNQGEELTKDKLANLDYKLKRINKSKAVWDKLIDLHEILSEIPRIPITR